MLIAALLFTQITSANLSESLDLALQEVNLQLKENQIEYTVDANKNNLLEKHPIFLQLNHADGSQEEIGITHFAKLDPEFENVEFSEVARTVNELVISIFKAIEIHSDAKSQQEGVLITSIGTPFYIGTLDISIEDEILHIEGKPIRYNDKPFKACWLTGEEGLTFEKLENGDYAVKNPIDKRKNKGIFFKLDQANGLIYRD